MRIWSEISHLQENNNHLNVLILLFHFNLIPVLVGFFVRKQNLIKSALLNYLTKRASDYLNGH